MGAKDLSVSGATDDQSTEFIRCAKSLMHQAALVHVVGVVLVHYPVRRMEIVEDPIIDLVVFHHLPEREADICPTIGLKILVLPKLFHLWDKRIVQSDLLARQEYTIALAPIWILID